MKTTIKTELQNLLVGYWGEDITSTDIENFLLSNKVYNYPDIAETLIDMCHELDACEEEEMDDILEKYATELLTNKN